MPTPIFLPLWPDGSPNNQIPDPAMPQGRPGLEIHRPPERGQAIGLKRAALVVCAGGAYGIRAEHEAEPLATLATHWGMVGCVLHYRVSPNHHPAPYADATRAVRLLRARSTELNIDPDRIAMIGFSAGGHLAATVATQPEVYLDPHDDLGARNPSTPAPISARPDRLILAYPLTSFVLDPANGSIDYLCGKEFRHTPAFPAFIRQFSAELHVDKDTPPTFLFHTAVDKSVSIDHSLFFASACARHGVPVELHVFEGGKHGLGMAMNIPRIRDWTTLLASWMQPWSAPMTA